MRTRRDKREMERHNILFSPGENGKGEKTAQFALSPAFDAFFLTFCAFADIMSAIARNCDMQFGGDFLLISRDFWPSSASC
jgi:hypothetical protein